MRFSRIEVRRVTRHVEELDDVKECKVLFSVILDRGLSFICKVRDLGHVLEDCYVITVSDEAVRLVSRKPSKLSLDVPYTKVESIEVVSNRELREEDDGGRWALI